MSMDEETPTMKPVYKFDFYETAEKIRVRLSRRSDELENDGPHFREEGVECLAEFARRDPLAEVTLVGLAENDSNGISEF